jgi:ubiquinone/menaquinone biosynthesis C-methylase UbiE
LRQCYDIASDRVKRYLEAEIDFVLSRLERNSAVLELGCGYGRVAFRLAEVAKRVVGIDTATESIALARRIAGSTSPCEFQEMDALELTFDTSEFDRVVCVQNGICAFGGDQDVLLREALRVTRPGGRVLFSTYSERFWPDRLAWFTAQAAVGLVGPIDYEQTGNGTIACKDGFRSGTVSPEAFLSFGKRLGVEPEVTEVDESSVFCEFVVPGTA